MFNVSHMALLLPLSLSVLLTNDHTVTISGGMSCTPRWVWGSYSSDCRLCHVILRTMLLPCWHLLGTRTSCWHQLPEYNMTFLTSVMTMKITVTPSGLAHTCQ